MLLALDVGNTNIVVGCMEGNTPLLSLIHILYDPEDIVTRAWRDARRGKDVSKYGLSLIHI